MTAFKKTIFLNFHIQTLYFYMPISEVVCFQELPLYNSLLSNMILKYHSVHSKESKIK